VKSCCQSWLLATLLLCGIVGCESKGPSDAKSDLPSTEVARAPQPVAVTIVPVATRAVERTIPVVGTLNGYEEITISPKIEGRVSQLFFDVGDRVESEAVLAELDDVDYRLAVEQAERTLEQELARLGLTKLPGPDFDPESNPTIVSARLLQENAQQQYERQQKLFAERASSAESFQRAETELKVAEAALIQARLQVQATAAAVRQRLAAVEAAQQKLADTRVAAPRIEPLKLSASGPRLSAAELSYVVAERMVSVGEMVRAFPTTPIYRLVLDDLLKFKATVPERYVSQISVGQEVRLLVEAWPGEVFPGAVSRINPTVDVQNRTFEIEVMLLNRDHRLKAGGFAKASVVTVTSTQALVLPLESLVRFAGVTKVFRIRDGKAEEVLVKLGARGPDWYEVLGELAAGDQIVTSGQTRLANGTPVTIRHPESPGSTGTDGGANSRAPVE
jgi:multidrug efflux pump subunit AcrA (membrane-fusion protein)